VRKFLGRGRQTLLSSFGQSHVVTCQSFEEEGEKNVINRGGLIKGRRAKKEVQSKRQTEIWEVVF